MDWEARYREEYEIVARVWKAVRGGEGYRGEELSGIVADYVKRAETAEAKLIAQPAPSGWQQRIAALRELIEEVWTSHRDPKDANYNECEKAECAWCEDTRKALDVISPATEGQNAVDAPPPAPPSRVEKCACGHMFHGDGKCAFCDCGWSKDALPPAPEVKDASLYVGTPCAACKGTGLVMADAKDASPPQPNDPECLARFVLRDGNLVVEPPDAIPPGPEGATAKATCQCGQFDMPDEAMKIEGRGYSLHARHKCSWGSRSTPAPQAPGEVVVECDCGNRDTITLPLTAMPPCSGGCGRRMRIVGIYHQNDPIAAAVRAELQPLEDALIDAGHTLAKDGEA
jgi:hypothetical protein